MNKKAGIIAGTIFGIIILGIFVGLAIKINSLSSEMSKKDKENERLKKETVKKQNEMDSLHMSQQTFENDSLHENFTPTDTVDNETFKKQLQEDAEKVKKEMIQEYEGFLKEAQRLKEEAGKNDKKLQAKLEREQQRVKELLQELRDTKASDTDEIMRLRNELNNLRSILQSYVVQVDSLQKRNQALHAENQNLRSQNANMEQKNSEKESQIAALNEKVAIASQLDATNFAARGLNKKSKTTEKVKDVKKIEIKFSISRNVTATTGTRSVFIRIVTPTGSTLTQGGSFNFENRTLDYSIKRDIEYTGEETPVVCYWDVKEALTAGTYHADIFADGHNIGGTTFSFR